jgi:hypothetical protein
MGSLNNGQIITKSTNLLRIHHQGNLLRQTNTNTDVTSTIISSGVIRRTNSGLIGIVHQPGGTATTSGLSSAERNADNSVEREKFTADGTSSGNLEHDVVRKGGPFVSISHREAILEQNRLAGQSGSIFNGGDALGPMQTISERKVFYLESDRTQASGFEDWTIFDSNGNAVGSNGTTDTDTTPNEGLLGS